MCHREFRPPVSMSVRGIDRTYAGVAIGARIGVAAGVVEGIRDTLQMPPRRGGLALLVAGESAVAQARIVVASNAAPAGALPTIASPAAASTASIALRIKNPPGRQRLR